ncbi:MAG TPA: hypothetical protein VKU19_39785 [Bryobacteraceae bacterium]|nr:hypothetical protein [Bryobacteraceae bacterium]
MRLLAVLFCGGLAATAQPAGDVLLHHNFESNTNGWTTLGPNGTLRVVNHALALNYEFRPKQLAIAVLPATPAFASLQRIRFRAKSDYDTAVGVLLSERPPGGRYLAWFWAPANIWQEIELTPSDFAVTDGPGDPVDADGKLDTDSLQGIGILDLAQFFAGVGADSEFPVAITQPSGSHTLLMEDFQLLRGARPSSAAGTIDIFDRNFLQWVTLGGMDLQLSTANPLGMRALRAKYEQSAEQFEILTRRLSSLNLSNATRLSFDIASEREATLIISLESKKGARHNMTVYPPGGREVFHVNLKLADFEGAGKIDPAQLKSLSLTDITAASGGDPATNTIWIGKVETRAN